MLTLTRKAGEKILIGGDIEVTVVSISGSRVRLGIRAPRKLPVHRAELVERVTEANQRALAGAIAESVSKGDQISFPEGLYGLREHDEFVLCDLEEGNPIRCLMSCKDPQVQLLVVDAAEAWPDYPSDEARQLYGAGEEEVAVALIVTVPADGSEVTANLMAPLVIGLETRRGGQVVLEKKELSIRAPFGVQRPASVTPGPAKQAAEQPAGRG